MTRKVLLGRGAGASGVGALALWGIALDVFGGCGTEVGRTLVEQDQLGAGTVVGEGANVLGAAASTTAVLLAVAGGAALVLAVVLLWLALRRPAAPPPA